jgi:hypothetical protein
MKVKFNILTAFLIIVVLSATSVIMLARNNQQLLNLQLLFNSFYILSLSVFAILFYTIHELTNDSWIKPVNKSLLLLSFGIFPFGLLFFVVFMMSNNPIASNTDGLNIFNQTIRYLVILLVWMLVVIVLMNNKLKTIFTGNILNKLIVPLSIPLLAVSYLVISYDCFIRPLGQIHSTVFGFYLLAGMLAALTGLSILIFKLFKISTGIKADYFLASYLFAFSMLWAYLWYSQFFLTWYANLPHENEFFINQYNHYKFLFYINLVLNFGLPFLLLLIPVWRKNHIIVGFASVSVVAGQWLDKYLFVVPQYFPSGKSLTIYEVLIAISFLSLLLMMFYLLMKKLK